MFRNFTSGFIAGSIATTLNTPLDVVKSRMQTVQTQVPKYRHTFHALTTIYTEEGFKALFKGYTARIIRLGPGGGIMLLAFDLFSSWLH